MWARTAPSRLFSTMSACGTWLILSKIR